MACNGSSGKPSKSLRVLGRAGLGNRGVSSGGLVLEVAMGPTWAGLGWAGLGQVGQGRIDAWVLATKDYMLIERYRLGTRKASQVCMEYERPTMTAHPTTRAAYQEFCFLKNATNSVPAFRLGEAKTEVWARPFPEFVGAFPLII